MIQTSSDPFVTQLAGLCRSHPTRAKWVVVPTHAMGRTLGERLALEGTSWVNLRFCTPLDLALDAAGPFLVQRGVTPLDDGLGPALMMRLLGDLPASLPGYFRTLAVHPEMGDALWRTLQDLRLAGQRAITLPASAFDNAAKHGELQALLQAFEGWLEANGQGDRATVFEEAARQTAWSPVKPGDVRVEWPDHVWAPLVRTFLDGLPGERMSPAVVAVPGTEVPRRLADRPRSPVEPASPLAFLTSPGDLPSPLLTAARAVSLFRAGGREAEVEEIFRRILSAEGGALQLDTVEIACAAPEDVSAVWMKAQRYDLDVTASSGLPVTVTRPARALLAWCDWVDEGYPAAALVRLLQTGDVRLDIDDGPSAGQAARLLRRAEATWGARTYDTTLAALERRCRDQSEDPELDDDARAYQAVLATHARGLRAWIAAVLARLPRDEEARVPLPDATEAARRFVRSYAAVADDLDAQAREAVDEALARLDILGDGACSATEATRLMRSAVMGLAIGADRPRPGRLHVTTLPAAGLSGRPHLFLTGLEEGRVFPRAFEDPVLLDVERGLLHPMLARSSDRVSEAVHAVTARLAVLPVVEAAANARPAPASVTISYSCRDLRESRETLPSSLVLHAVRLRTGGAEPSAAEREAALGDVKSVVPEAASVATGFAGWWLANVKRAGMGAGQAVLKAFPALESGLRAEAARDSEAFTEWDGWVPAAGPILDPRQSGTAVSATALEKLAECPFRYFLEQGLGIEPVEEDGEDDDQWLDAKTRGTVLHDLYADVMRELRRLGDRADPAKHRAMVTELGGKHLDEIAREMPPPSVHVFERERDLLLRDLVVFLEQESQAAQAARAPVAFEVAFGYEPGGAADRREPLNQREPVGMTVGTGRIRLRGKIDRIDEIAPGTFEVTDYKTGSYFRPRFSGVFRGGRLLQHALYGVAAATLLRRQRPGAVVASGRYYFPTVGGGGNEHVIARPATAKLEAVLTDLLDIARDGAFLAAPMDEKDKKDRKAGGDPCHLCELGGSCGHDATGRAKRKFTAGAGGRLAAFERLRHHE